MKYKHGEAFCLMEYVSDDDTEREVIWNSRDGVTPFIITLKSGKVAVHKNWHLDRCDPNYDPPKGSRMFVDMTEERAEELAQKRADHYWDNNVADVQSMYDSKEEFRATMLVDIVEDMRRGAPDLVEVT